VTISSTEIGLAQRRLDRVDVVEVALNLEEIVTIGNCMSGFLS
jgi:hypothetical protein